MTQDEVVGALRALRMLRRGTVQPETAPACLRPFLAHGLGPACDQFAAWVRRSGADPRAADAAIRFFGLIRLPEGLRQVGAALAPLHQTGRPGVCSRQAEKLVNSAVSGMASKGPSPTAKPSERAAPPPLRDPFPLPHEPASRRWIAQVVTWGWAQVPAGDRMASAALLHYQHEHGLRASAVPRPSSRMERLRWRRLAWSVLHVAQYRATLAAGSPGAGSAGELAGVGLVAVSGDGSHPDGLEALTAACIDPSRLADPDLAMSALEYVRTAMRDGRHEAPDLYGLLSDGVARYRAAAGFVPPLLESKLITLTAIVARERRDPAGIPAARAGLRRIDELLDTPAADRDHDTFVWHVESGYRTSQELADLYLSLGRFAEARAAADIMRTLLHRFGDPDPSYLPYGWHWNLLVTESSVNRHMARASAGPEPWRQAAAIAARRAADLAAAAGLPDPWALASENEIIATALDRLALPPYRASREGSRLLDDVSWRIRQLDSRSEQILDQPDRATRSALLQAKLLAWRLALMQADPAAIRTARAGVLRAQQSWTAPILPIEAETVARYTAASVQSPGRSA